MAKTQILDVLFNVPDKGLADAIQGEIETGLGGPITAAHIPTLLFIPATGKFAWLAAPQGGASVAGANMLREQKAAFNIPDSVYSPTISVIPLLETDEAFTAPSLTSPWFQGGANNFDRTVATFTRKSGGWFGISALFGQTTKFYWAIQIAYAPPKGAVVEDGDSAIVADPAPIPKRWFIGGFESDGGDNDTGPTGRTGVAGARWLDGWGFAQRDTSGTSTAIKQQPTSTPNRHGTWERFRFQCVRFPSAEVALGEWEQVAQSGEGFKLALTNGGQIALKRAHDSAVIGTFGLVTLGSWNRLEVLVYYFGQTGPPQLKVGQIAVYLNGELLGTGGFTPGGLVGSMKLSFSMVGKDGGNSEDGYVNFDDWVGSALPADRNPATAEWASGNSYTAGDIVQTTAIHTTNPSAVIAWICKITHSNPSPNPATDSSGTWARLGKSKDATTGSRVVPIFARTAAGDHANWTGDVRQLCTRAGNGFPTSGNTGLTSSVSGAVMSVDSDVDKIRGIPGCLGMVAANIALWSTRGAASGTLGWNITGWLNNDPATQAADFADATMQAIVQTGAGSYSWQGGTGSGDKPALWAPTGLTKAIVPETFKLRHIKGAGADASTVKCLIGSVEVIGIFGPEDVPAGTVSKPTFVVGHNDKHNHHYENSPYANNNSRAHAPVVIVGGTYVGNGTALDLTFRLPVHWLWVRNTSGATVGWRWFNVMIGAIQGGDEGYTPQLVCRAEKDPTFVPGGGEDDKAERYRITISGNDAIWNANAATYQYIAFCDPAARFMLAGAFNSDDVAPPLPFQVALANTNFTPTFGFFHTMSRSTTSSKTLGFKAAGHATAAGQRMGLATVLANFVTFAGGAFTVDTDLVQLDPDHCTYALMRADDGNGDPNRFKIWSQMNYTGDGAASRTLSFPNATGLRPLFAFVAGAGGSNFGWRDPSHTGTTSSDFAGTIQASAYISGGGPDSISVGLSLNANGTVYNVFVLWGSATAGNGGWSINGEFIPVEPDSEKPPGWAEPVETPINVGGGGGGGGGGPLISTPDLDTGTTPGVTDLGGTGPLGSTGVNNGGLVGGQPCEVYTRALLNMALQRIGQSKVIANAATDNTEEATIARQFVLEDVNQVLRDFPWPFATRYSTLVLVGGTAAVPVNNDWQYSYRAPSGMMFARRIAKKGVFRAAEPSPVQFRETSDSTGTMLFCNEPTSTEVPLVLEWTARITCPAFYGDAKFRDALAWRFAASFSMPLAKDSKKQEFCLQMYEKVLNEAQVDAVNEQQESPFVDPEAEWISGRQ